MNDVQNNSEMQAMNSKTRKALETTHRELDKSWTRIYKAWNRATHGTDEHDTLSELMTAIEKGMGVCIIALDPPVK